MVSKIKSKKFGSNKFSSNKLLKRSRKFGQETGETSGTQTPSPSGGTPGGTPGTPGTSILEKLKSQWNWILIFMSFLLLFTITVTILFPVFTEIEIPKYINTIEDIGSLCGKSNEDIKIELSNKLKNKYNESEFKIGAIILLVMSCLIVVILGFLIFTHKF